MDLDEHFRVLVQRRRWTYRHSPVVEVIGIVDPAGPAWVRLGDEVAPSLTFSFADWRRLDGAAEGRRLYVFRPGGVGAFFDSRRIGPGAILRVRLRLNEEIASGPEAGLLRVLGKAEDDLVMSQRRADLLTPRQITDDQLGAFVEDKRVHWFRGAGDWAGQSVDLVLDAEDSDSAKEALSWARRLLDRRDSWDRQADALIVSRMLELANDWCQDPNKTLTAEDLLESLRLHGVHVSPTGGVSAWFDDGGIFAGHSVVVMGDVDNGPADVEMVG